MEKYVKCAYCGRNIEMGQDVYAHVHYVGICCSAECFLNFYNYGHKAELTEDLAAEQEVTIFNE